MVSVSYQKINQKITFSQTRYKYLKRFYSSYTGRNDRRLYASETLLVHHHGGSFAKRFVLMANSTRNQKEEGSFHKGNLGFVVVARLFPIMVVILAISMIKVEGMNPLGTFLDEQPQDPQPRLYLPVEKISSSNLLLILAASAWNTLHAQHLTHVLPIRPSQCQPSRYFPAGVRAQGEYVEVYVMPEGSDPQGARPPCNSGFSRGFLMPSRARTRYPYCIKAPLATLHYCNCHRT